MFDVMSNSNEDLNPVQTKLIILLRDTKFSDAHTICNQKAVCNSMLYKWKNSDGQRSPEHRSPPLGWPRKDPKQNPHLSQHKLRHERV